MGRTGGWMMSFGEELRRERELRQISLDDVAQATKINIRYLDAMERNDFLHLPGGVFNRGFVRAYCEFIGVNSEPMVNAYLVEERSQATRGRSGAALSVREAVATHEGAGRARPQNRLVVYGGLAVVIAVLLAVTFWVWSTGWLTSVSGSPK
jgi:cytoskeleton protein RodZ